MNRPEGQIAIENMGLAVIKKHFFLSSLKISIEKYLITVVVWILCMATILLQCNSIARAVDIRELLLDNVHLYAVQGDGDSQYRVGIMYYDGIGITQDYLQAIKWLHLAAEQGHAEAQYKLGFIYFKGRGGVPRNDSEVMKWYRLAAKQGHVIAQYNLGSIYANGKIVTQDYVRAYKWFDLAASKENKNAKESQEILAEYMTLAQIVEAQKMAQDCERKSYKNCE